jgi:aspartyl-tRNA(Asn)/glutamyl-tRNA(Gln) amidotransferase subunit C
MAHPIDAMPLKALAQHTPSAAQGMALRLRDDVVSEPNQREANQRSAPAVERGLFLVPKVIE